MRHLGLIVLVLAVTSIGCEQSTSTGGQKASLTAEAENIDIQGAGATFPYPLYSKWMAEYQKVDPRVRINYQSIGSGGGIRQILERTVDFGSTDAAMSDRELARSADELFHIPMTLGAVVVIYNLPGVSALRLTPELLTAIFLGEIKKWDDRRLAELNPEAKLPAQNITVVFRSDGSGTTAVFTEYLSRVSAAWKQKAGAGKSVRFPSGLGAKGNEGVSGQVKTTPGSVGYTELAYAKQTGLTVAALKNRNGNFVQPALPGITAAAEGAASAMPDDLRISIVDAEGAQAYPISSFTYILAYREQTDRTKGKALAGFLWWAIHQGQSFSSNLHYAPLPAPAVTKIEARLRLLSAGGQPLLQGK